MINSLLIAFSSMVLGRALAELTVTLSWMTAVTADLPSWSLLVSPNTYQFSCSALTSFIQPQSRDHCREIRSPDTRYKNGFFTDLEKQEKAPVNQITCQGTLQLMSGSYQSPVLKWFLLLSWSYQHEWRCAGRDLENLEKYVPHLYHFQMRWHSCSYWWQNRPHSLPFTEQPGLAMQKK